MKKYYENVILITRGILEKQHRNRMSLKREKGRNMNYVGIDIGSTASKVVVEGDKKEHFVLPTGWSSKETCEKIKNKLLEMGVDVTSVDFADHVITEITCHARGGRELAGGDCSIIDVGGQDTKVNIVQNGMVSDFQMNDKCSAGTGKFLEIMANRLGVTINELFDMAAAGEVIPISSLCTVFAESEVINYIGEGKKREDIAAGVVDCAEKGTWRQSDPDWRTQSQHLFHRNPVRQAGSESGIRRVWPFCRGIRGSTSCQRKKG